MKQRLVGTIVLVCLALIIIPLLLDGEGVESVGINTVIPPPPEITAEAVAEPERPQIFADEVPEALIIPEETQSLPEYSADIPEPAALQAGTLAEPEASVPAFDAQGLPEGWSVRTGIFGEPANAQGLLASLLEQGYKAYTAQVRAGERVFTGVFVGPVLTRAEANGLKSELDDRLGEETLVTRFSIEELP